jgi:uncharacterized protein YndB with AHSA1/START domain
MAARNSAEASADRELLITRVFDAPRPLVFKAWSKPEHLMRWWGPHGCALTVCETDFRPGGSWRFCMRGPGGGEEWQQGVYREIVEPERLVFTYSFPSGSRGFTEDAKGKPGHETIVTVNFYDDDGKTRLTVHQAVFENNTVRDDHIRGWNEALDHLAAYVTQAELKATTS